MKKTRLIMGMPVTVEMADPIINDEVFDVAFSYFEYIDQKFSTYKSNSEISMINDERLKIKDSSRDMKTVFKLAQKTKKETQGYFDISYNNRYDPSGLVKGWAIYNAFKLLKKKGFKNFYIEAGGDIQVIGKNKQGKRWSVGIKNPLNQKEIVKSVFLKDEGIATSGNYVRRDHIYVPDKISKSKDQSIGDIISLTVIGPNVYEADRFATAAFAMGKKGINFIENLKGFEGYMIDKNGIATLSSNFEKYTI